MSFLACYKNDRNTQLAKMQYNGFFSNVSNTFIPLAEKEKETVLNQSYISVYGCLMQTENSLVINTSIVNYFLMINIVIACLGMSIMENGYC